MVYSGNDSIIDQFEQNNSALDFLSKAEVDAE